MKQFTLICILLVLSYTTIAQRKSDREKLGLIGNVKSIKETSYIEVEKFGELVKEKKRKEYWLRDFYYIYNRKGNTIKKYAYNSDGNLYSEYTFEYNQKGYATISKGKIGLDVNSFKSGINDYKSFKYDEMGNVLEIINYSTSNETFTSKYSFKYNKKGEKIEENYYRTPDKLESKTKYKYDNKGNVFETNLYHSNGKLKYRYIRKYDTKGNEIEIQTYKPDGSVVYRGTFKYDNFGNIIEKNENTTYKYEYDQKGNWISKIEFDDNVKKYIIIREIEYFK